VSCVFAPLGFENFTAQISPETKKTDKYIGTDENWKKQKMLLSMLLQIKV
jgi:hypothetical protein